MRQILNKLQLIIYVLLGLTVFPFSNSSAQANPFSHCNFGPSLDISITIADIKGEETINPLGPLAQKKDPEGPFIIPRISEMRILPQTVDYRILIPDTQVYIFGETHTSATTKNELANNMDIFKEAGVTNLGMEMFGTDVQYMLDEYNRGASNEDEIRKYLSENWGYKEIIDSYMNLIAAARALGISIIALDTPGHTGNIEERNNHMVSIIEDTLRNNSNAKIITLNGTMHIQINGEGMQKTLSEHFINVGSAVILAEDSRKDLTQELTTMFMGIANPKAPFMAEEYQQNISILFQIAEEGLSSERFMTPHTDFYGVIIHLP